MKNLFSLYNRMRGRATQGRSQDTSSRARQQSSAGLPAPGDNFEQQAALNSSTSPLAPARPAQAVEQPSPRQASNASPRNSSSIPRVPEDSLPAGPGPLTREVLESWRQAADISEIERVERSHAVEHFLASYFVQGAGGEGRFDWRDGFRLYNYRHISSLPAEVTSIEQISLINLPSLDRLPAGQYVGQLFVSECDNLVSLPNDSNFGEVNIENCANFQRLGDNLTCSGSLSVANSPSFRDVGENIRIADDLFVSRSAVLAALPASLVAKNVSLCDLPQLTTLPEGIQITNLSLLDCINLATIPERLNLSELRLVFCPRLQELPADCVGDDGSLYITQCEGIESLPEGMAFHRLMVAECDRLLTLPSDLQTDAAEIRSCRGLQSIPESLRTRRLILSGLPLSSVGNVTCRELEVNHCEQIQSIELAGSVDSVRIRNCQALQQLSPNLVVDRRLEIEHCPNLRSLPFSLESWPSPSEGLRTVSLVNTGIFPAEDTTFRHEMGGLTTLRYLSPQRADAHWRERLPESLGDPFEDYRAAPRSFEEQLDNWFALLPVSSHAAISDVKAMISALDGSQRQLISAFLTQLRLTAEYNSEQYQPVLAVRVVHLLSRINQSEELLAVCCDRIGAALHACGDRATLMLDQAEVAVRVYEAEHGEYAEEELRKLGISVLHLNVVHNYVQDRIKAVGRGEAIEVFLAYEVGLRERLDLPIDTAIMLFDERVTKVRKEDLDSAERAALAVSRDPVQLENHLATWGPWQAYQRRLEAKNFQFEALPVARINFDAQSEPVCPFTQEPLHRLEEPVLLQMDNVWRGYECKDFLTWWVPNGSEPTLKRRVALNELSRFAAQRPLGSTDT